MNKYDQKQSASIDIGEITYKKMRDFIYKENLCHRDLVYLHPATFDHLIIESKKIFGDIYLPFQISGVEILEDETVRAGKLKTGIDKSVIYRF